MNKFLCAFSIFASVLMISACGKESEKDTSAPAADTVEVSKIIIGLDDSFPPMGFRDEQNNIVGFDIDMAREATKRMNVEPEFKPIDWGSKEAELISKRVDLLWNGLTITEQRKQKLAFTQPYMENHQIIIVKADSSIKSKADLAGKIIGVQDASSAVDAIEAEPEVLKSFKELRKYRDNVLALADLDTNRTEAIVLDEVVGRYYISKHEGKYVVLEDHFGQEEYGVGVRQEDTELLAKLQAALDEMKADGTSAKIAEQWFGENIIK